MFFPESLYLLSSKDQQVTWLDPVYVRQVQTVALASIVEDYTIPQGQVLLLQHAGMQTAPGAAQNNTGQALVVKPTVATQPQVILDQTLAALAAGVNGWFYWNGTILVPPTWSVRASATFNAGAAANTVILFLVGMLIPVGNLQRV
jgi:hypothetical protein